MRLTGSRRIAYLLISWWSWRCWRCFAFISWHELFPLLNNYAANSGTVLIRIYDSWMHMTRHTCSHLIVILFRRDSHILRQSLEAHNSATAKYDSLA